MARTADLVYETSTTEGTVDFTVAAVTGWRRFSDAFGTGTAADNYYYYHIRHDSAAEWEQGIGHSSAASTLVRDVVLRSSNSNSAVNFAAGDKDVVCDRPGFAGDAGPTLAIPVKNITGSTIVADKLLSITGFDADQVPTVALADSSVNDRRANGFTRDSISNNGYGIMHVAGIMEGVDTSSGIDSGIIYLGTSGDFSVPKPATGFTQEIGSILEDAVSGKMLLLITGSTNETYINEWETGRKYQLGNPVKESSKLYVAKTTHTAGATFAGDLAVNWELLNDASVAVGEFFMATIPTPAAGATKIVLSAPFAMDLTTLTYETSAGTVDFDVEIDGTDVTGLAGLTATTTEQQATATAANSVSAGETVTINITSVSTPSNGIFQLEATKT